MICLLDTTPKRLFFLGELVNVTKLKDDVIDSGIEESSTTSEVRKGSASTFGVKIKQERQTSDESSDDSYQAPPTASKKRKLSFGNDSTIAKRIKSEPVEPETSSQSFKSSQSKSTSVKKGLSSQSSEKPSSKDKKKRKSRAIDDIDEFEKSIQKLLSSTQIKKEK